MEGLYPLQVPPGRRDLLGPVPRNLGFEVAEAGPVEPFVEIDFSDDDVAPLLGLSERAAIVAVDGGHHPVARCVGVSAADDVDVVLAGAGGSEHRVAAPDR